MSAAPAWPQLRLWHDSLLIGGQRRRPVAPAGHSDVTDPSTGRVIGRVPNGTAADVELAVAAAKEAGAAWARTTPEARAELLTAVATRMRAWVAEFAFLISSEMGAPIDNARDTQTGLAIEVFESFAEIVAEFAWQEQLGSSVVVHEPIGVVAAITPWNYPLYLASSKIAAALAAGCAVVFKPSGDAPLDAFLLVELIEQCAHELREPAGIVNLVTGEGPVVGGALSTHPDVAAISFTGSTDAGRLVSASAAQTVKRVGLELGGKSAAIVVDDVVDLPGVLAGALADVFYNSGQTCTACARILLPANRYEEALEMAAEIAGNWELGDPRRPGNHIGPIATRRQYETVLEFIEQGKREGARLLAGGQPEPHEVPAELAAGNWILPTVFSHVTSEMTIAREEIFGPVAVLIAYEDDDDAVRIANDSIYGLSGAVWAHDRERAMRIAKRMQTGRVVINDAPFSVLAPTGGYKQSGNGRELGVHGLREYLEVKCIQL